MGFQHLKKGDKVTRLLSSARVPMELVVIATSETLVTCSLHADVTDPGSCWTFDMATGAEVDDELEWGPAYGATGSFLKPESNWS